MVRAVHVHEHVNVYVNVYVNVDVNVYVFVNVNGSCHSKILSMRERNFGMVVRILSL